MEKEESIFFVEIREPIEVRRNIFGSLKDIVETLHRFEKFKSLRREKIHSLNKLSGDLKSLNKILSDLKGVIKETKIREIKIKSVLKEEKKEKPKKKRNMAQKEVIEKKPLAEIDRLESELSVIEEKLKGLDRKSTHL